MVRLVERFRKTIGKTEVGLPHFSPEERADILQKARNFVAEVKQVAPESGVDKHLFYSWVPKATDFAKPEKIGDNKHAYHNIAHIATVVGKEMFLLPVVQVMYKDALSSLQRPFSPTAAIAAAAGHDLLRTHDVLGAIPESTYKIHGEKMAKAIREGKAYAWLSPDERSIAATSIQYHDVDHRDPHTRNPEDELLAIVDRGELVRLIHGVGFVPKGARAWEHISGKNKFIEQQTYVSHYFPDLAEKIKPLSQAMLTLRLEGMRKGLSQADSVWYAMQELGMTKEEASGKSAA